MSEDEHRPPAAEPDSERVGAHWSRRLARGGEFSPEVFWLAVPEVHRHYNARATRGSRYASWVDYCVGEFLAGRTPVERMLSIGCGTGQLERHLALLGAFSACEAWDVAPGALATARREAKAAGLASVRYEVRDANTAELAPGRYDAVWFNSSLHHLHALERACEQVAASLKPDGLLFLNEYVGASRFDFPPRQREVIRAAHGLIPERLRRRRGEDGSPLADLPPLPDPAAVEAADPSESVRSGEILEVVGHYFEVLACNPAGGTVLQFLLQGIAGHFRPEDEEAMRVLELLLRIEDTLIDAGDLPSDFVVLVGSPRRPPPPARPAPAPGIPPRPAPTDEPPTEAALRDEVERLRARLRTLEGTRLWRLANLWWRARRRLRAWLG